MQFDELLVHLDRHIQTASSLAPSSLSAQQWMAPQTPRRWPDGFSVDRLRHAAGLLLFVPHSEGARIVLTERAHTLDRHRGQISLPGGVIERNETVEDAALREAHEEIGIDISQVRVLGLLTPVDIPVSGFRLHPVIAALHVRPSYHLATDEVARVLEVDIDTLMRAECIAWRTLEREGHRLDFPAFAVHGVDIWGATAMVISELLARLGWCGPPPRA
jgi:8-oxo-dGTP pyrophosphatase MutT (NUDIX family)